MKINFDDIIDRHSGIPAVVTLHGPTLNLHKQKIIDYQKENKILRFSVNNWYDYFDLSPSYWILSSSEDAFGVGKLLDTVCNHNVPLFYSDEGDFTEKTVLIYQLDFTMKMKFYGPVNDNANIIREINIDFEKFGTAGDSNIFEEMDLTVAADDTAEDFTVTTTINNTPAHDG